MRRRRDGIELRNLSAVAREKQDHGVTVGPASPKADNNADSAKSLGAIGSGCADSMKARTYKSINRPDIRLQPIYTPRSELRFTRLAGGVHIGVVMNRVVNRGATSHHKALRGVSRNNLDSNLRGAGLHVALRGANESMYPVLAARVNRNSQKALIRRPFQDRTKRWRPGLQGTDKDRPGPQFWRNLYTNRHDIAWRKRCTRKWSNDVNTRVRCAAPCGDYFCHRHEYC
jgi:hypothetical protein